MTETDNLIKIYTECSNGYHKVDDFRAKLLGFLPLASGVGIFGALYTPPNSTGTLHSNFVAWGIFGVLITLGLLIFELKGILKCTQFIFLGAWIEGRMKEIAKDDVNTKDFDKLLTGYFKELCEQKEFMSNVVTEPVASAIIYSTVIAAWSYVIFLTSGCLKVIIPIIVFLLFSGSMYVYWKVIFARIQKRYKNSEM